MQEQQAHVVTIDLLRFLCAAAVVAHHLLPLALPPGGTSGLDSRYSWSGWVGVQVFFVISGYVIAQSAQGSAARAFLRRRVLRLAPAAWLCASLTAGAEYAVGYFPPATITARWLAALAFVPMDIQIDRSYWTLSVEWSFYLIVAVCLALGWSGERALTRLAIALGGAAALFWMAALTAGATAPFLLQPSDWRIGILPFAGYFALGIVLRHIAARGATPERVAGALALTAMGCGLVLAGSWQQPGTGLALYPAASVIGFVIGVASIALAPQLHPLLLRLFGRDRLVLLGLMTYPLYLLHCVIGYTIILALIGHGVPRPVAGTLGIATIMALAWYVTVRVEPPLRAWLMRALDRIMHRGPARDTRRIASLPAG